MWSGCHRFHHKVTMAQSYTEIFLYEGTARIGISLKGTKPGLLGQEAQWIRRHDGINDLQFLFAIVPLYP